MYVTFMIGNGFDLACGLKTSYLDMYNSYCETFSKNNNISEFKKMLNKHKYDKWADFELALPDIGKEIDDFDKFSECIIDFTAFVNDYLILEQNRINLDEISAEVEKGLENYFYKFPKYCLQKSANILNSLVNTNTESTILNFISFNYTDTLDKYLSHLKELNKIDKRYKFSYDKTIHIHSTLDNGIILGLDNEELYKNIPNYDIRKLKNLIDKVHINSRQTNLIEIVKQKLLSSRIIVIIGWSMGKSDSYWVDTISKHFLSNNSIQLVHFPYYKTPIDRKFNNIVLDREDESKDKIREIFNIPETEENRIHIITNSSYLTLNELIVYKGNLVTIE